MNQKIHPTAVVHPKAELDSTVEVGPYTVVGEGARLGPGTVLHNHVTIQGRTTLGRDNIVYPYAVLGAEPQDLKFKGEHTELVLGDRNKVREHATIHRGTEHGGGRTVIGSDTLIMVGVHIAHDCTIEDQVVIANGCMLGGHCLIEFGAGLGGGAGVHHFTTVGTLSFVGGMARVTMDVPPYTVVEGSPALVRKLNTTALVRRAWAPESLDRLRRAYRVLFRTPLIPFRLRAESLRHEPGQLPEVVRLCDFLERTSAGVHGRQLESLRSDQRGRRPRRG